MGVIGCWVFKDVCARWVARVRRLDRLLLSWLLLSWLLLGWLLLGWLKKGWLLQGRLILGWIIVFARWLLLGWTNGVCKHFAFGIVKEDLLAVCC